MERLLWVPLRSLVRLIVSLHGNASHADVSFAAAEERKLFSTTVAVRARAASDDAKSDTSASASAAESVPIVLTAFGGFMLASLPLLRHFAALCDEPLPASVDACKGDYLLTGWLDAAKRWYPQPSQQTGEAVAHAAASGDAKSDTLPGAHTKLTGQASPRLRVHPASLVAIASFVVLVLAGKRAVR